MTSARKKAAETMANIDVVIEVLDARLPEASSNPLIRMNCALFRQRPCLKLLNKADLADPVATKAWLDFYNSQKGVKAVAVSRPRSRRSAGQSARPVPDPGAPSGRQLQAPAHDDHGHPQRGQIHPDERPGEAQDRRRRRRAGGHQIPAERGLSPRLTLVDTPGLMWPKIEHDSDGYMLAASHAIGRNAVLEEEVATFLAGILLAALSRCWRSATSFPCKAWMPPACWKRWRASAAACSRAGAANWIWTRPPCSC
jgi:ribosome biogenesis GTPase A